jgi:hypothetical protein
MKHIGPEALELQSRQIADGHPDQEANQCSNRQGLRAGLVNIGRKLTSTEYLGWVPEEIEGTSSSSCPNRAIMPCRLANALSNTVPTNSGNRIRWTGGAGISLGNSATRAST